jgi:lipopolysaccharide export LptBFGC system permease protein LptF
MLLPIGFALFIHKINIISILSLLFATLTTIQTYEKQNINTAISMSGMHSFRIIRPVIFLAFALSIFHLFINHAFLGTSLKILNKNYCLTANDQNLHVKKLDGGFVFYSKDFKNFTFIDKDKNVVYAKSGKLSPKGVELSYSDHFKKIDGVYEKVLSLKSYTLQIDPKFFFEEQVIYNSDNLITLFKFYNNSPIENTKKIQITLLYRILIPFLHLFAVFFASCFAFARFFRKKPYFTLFVSLFCLLLFLYLLETFSMLADANILSPLFFLAAVLISLLFFPLLLYVKKV